MKRTALHGQRMSVDNLVTTTKNVSWDRVFYEERGSQETSVYEQIVACSSQLPGGLEDRNGDRW